MREKRKSDRRNRIIQSAEELIRTTGSTDFSMNQLASHAGLSTPTTYNLIGSKATVLYLLLNQYQDRVDVEGLVGQSSRNPFLNVLRAADAAVDVYITDSIFIRPLMQFLIGLADEVNRPAFMQRGFQYWWRSLKGLERKNLLEDSDVDLMARDFVIFFTGLIDFWVNGELTDDEFRFSARHGTLLRLIAVGSKEHTPRLMAELRKVAKKVPIAYERPKI